MEAAMLELSASEPRERLFAFVEGVVRPLPHVRQRENALVYVRGLIEHGGRKSLQPTLFRLGESPARYESVQQFLADSPWEPELLIRACAERVAPELGVLAWVVDDTGIVKDGKHSPGVKRQYSGTLGKIGNCQIAVSLHAVGERGTLPLGLLALSARGVVCRSERRRQGEDPRRRRLQDEAAARELAGRAGGRLGDSAGAAPRRLRLRRRHRFPHALARARARVRGRRLRPDQRLRAGDDLRGARAQWQRRAAAHGRPARPQAGVGAALAARLPRRAWKTLPCRTTPAGEDVSSRFAFVRVVATHPVRTDYLPPREEWLIIEWPAGEEAPSDYWLSNLPDDSEPRAARPARPPALDDRTRLPPAQGRARTRPLRRPKLPRLPPPLRARHLRARLPHARSASPESPAAGLTLPQAVLLLQPVLRCWAGRCRTCNQPVDLDQLTLFHRRE